MRRSLLHVLALPILLLSACRVEPVDPPGDASARVIPAPGLSGDQGADRAALERLDAAARALARTEGCSSVEQCRNAPVGARACGGPRFYLPYCPLTTDEDALRRQITEVEKFERAFNQRYGIVSTCELRMPPELELSGDACRAATR